MTVWICTDMEGLAGIDHWDQCYHPDDDAPAYRYGREQLTAEANAAIAGCFDAGASGVWILDGHGRNRNRGFTEALDPRARKAWIAQRNPVRWEGLDEKVDALAVIGQHAMAGTIDGFLDHTQSPKELCRYKINGDEAGEMSQIAVYAGAFGVPLVYVSGDEACCAEAHHLFPHAVTTPTKRGTGWDSCVLYPPDDVRANIRRDIARALETIDPSTATRVATPLSIEVEWAWSGKADPLARIPGVRRLDARTVSWQIADPRDLYGWPGANWRPLPDEDEA